MVDIATGEVKGRHDGLMYYTLGQRQGLGIGGSGNGEPWFVADKNLEKNQLLVVQGDAHASLYSTGLTATGVNWIAGAEHMPNVPYRCTAKFRYRQPDQGVTLTWQEDGSVDVQFDQQQKPSRQDKPLFSTTERSAWVGVRSIRCKKYLYPQCNNRACPLKCGLYTIPCIPIKKPSFMYTMKDGFFLLIFAKK